MSLQAILSVMLIIAMLGAALVGCSGNGPAEQTISSETTCQHTYETVETAGVFADKVAKHTCSQCGDTYEETVAPATKSIKILAFGNSFNYNSSRFLFDIAEAAGAEEIVIGCLWIGGATVADHANNVLTNAAKYEYQKNTTGRWETIPNATVEQALKDVDWDFICLNQQSAQAGQPESYRSALNILGKYMQENMPEGCEFWFNMTWAYDAGFTTNENFQRYYDCDQMKMYEAIRDTCRGTVMESGYVAGLVSCGTAMQNLRSSWASDQVTLDGYHASTFLGCYTLGLTWLATWTDIDIAALEYFPRMGTKWGRAYEYALREIAKEAVLNTMANPYEPSESQFKEQPEFEEKY